MKKYQIIYTETEKVLVDIHTDLKTIISLLGDRYLGTVNIGGKDWGLINSTSHSIITKLKILRDKDGEMFREGPLLKWEWTKDLSSTRISSVDGWEITHDHWLYNIFGLTPPKGTLPFDKIWVNGNVYRIIFRSNEYNVNIPSQVSLCFHRDNCSFGILQLIEMEWLLGRGEYGKYHREGGLPAIIKMTQGGIGLKYYLHGLEHGGNKYYGFDSRLNEEGLTSIRCPECGGKGERTYIKESTGYSPGGMGWTPMHYLERTPYKDKCHMCSLPLENKGRGWIVITPQNEKAIQKLALSRE